MNCHGPPTRLASAVPAVIRAIAGRMTRRGPNRSTSAPRAGWLTAFTRRLSVAARASVERSPPSSSRIGLKRTPKVKLLPVPTKRTAKPVASAVRRPALGTLTAPDRPGARSRRARPRGRSAETVLPLGVRREGYAVARSIGDPDQAVGRIGSRHVEEQVGRHPVHELDEEAVRERAGDVDRELVDDVRRDQELVR